MASSPQAYRTQLPIVWAFMGDTPLSGRAQKMYLSQVKSGSGPVQTPELESSTGSAPAQLQWRILVLDTPHYSLPPVPRQGSQQGGSTPTSCGDNPKRSQPPAPQGRRPVLCPPQDQQVPPPGARKTALHCKQLLLKDSAINK